LECILEEQRQTIKHLEKKLKILPTGELHIQKRAGVLYCFRRTEQRLTGITKNRDLCSKLANKACCRYQRNCLQMYCRMLEQLIRRIRREEEKLQRSHLANTIRRLPMMDLGSVGSFHVDPDARQWADRDYITNTYHSEQLKYRTSSGRMVRSKSERAIANLLEQYAVPYRYEPEMIIDGKAIYPDFVLMKSDGSLMIWEHFGLMDNDTYQLHALQKQERYRQAGYHQHTNLICTYEEDMISEKKLEDIFLRYQS